MRAAEQLLMVQTSAVVSPGVASNVILLTSGDRLLLADGSSYILLS